MGRRAIRFNQKLQRTHDNLTVNSAAEFVTLLDEIAREYGLDVVEQ